MVLSSVAPTLVSYTVSYLCHTLSHTHHTVSLLRTVSHTHHTHHSHTHHLDRSSPFEAIDWMINSVIPETPSLTHLHSLSLMFSLMVSYYHHVISLFSHNLCSHSISSLTHKSSHKVSYYHQVFSHVIPHVLTHNLCSHRYPSYTSHPTH